MSLAVSPSSWPGDASPRCAPLTRAQGVDPIGSAGTYERFVLVEWPLPWPRDVSLIPELARAVKADRASRVFAVVPESDRAPGRLAVTVWQRTGTNHLRGTDHQVEVAGLDALVAAAVGDPSGTSATALGAAPPEVLLCTHGKRDVCCGGMGTVLHREVSERWDGVRVRRCSHTGGHRFAPTGLSFPDGRAWAFLDGDVLEQVVRRDGDVVGLRAHQRGCTALDPWAQVVERAVFEHVGWGWLDCEVTQVVVQRTEDRAEVTLAWTRPDGSSGRAVGQVEVARQLPVPDCGRPTTGEPKTSPELRLASIALDAGS